MSDAKSADVVGIYAAVESRASWMIKALGNSDAVEIRPQNGTECTFENKRAGQIYFASLNSMLPRASMHCTEE